MRASLNRIQGPRIVQPVIKNKVSPLLIPSSSQGTVLAVENPIDLEASKSNEIIKTHHPILTPASELSENRPLLHSVSSMIFDLNDLLNFKVEPRLVDASKEDICELFNDKCKQCLQVCDFNDDDQQKEKQSKQEILEDILAVISNPNVVELFSEKEYLALFQMFTRNVIRTTPPPPDIWFAPVSIDFTLDRIEERGWSHLSLFYDILIAFFANSNYKPDFCLQECHKLLNHVISMFISPDNREREKIMKLFHGIYRTMKKLRNSSRKQISKFLRTSIHSPHPRLGISEILNAFVPIIAGFKIPVHKENVYFFEEVLLPLHTSPHLHMFHTALVNTVTTYLSKDEKSVNKVYNMIIDHWPVTAPTKQILLLNEMELLFSLIKNHADLQSIKKICKVIASCSSSQNFTVAERSLMLWESDSFMSLVTSSSKYIFPILIPDIYKTATSHWCFDVRTLALNAMRVLKGCDMQSFERYGVSFKKSESEKIMMEISKGKFWNSLIDHFVIEPEQESKRNILRTIYIGCEALNKSIEPTIISPTSEKKPKPSMSPKSPQPILKCIMNASKSPQAIRSTRK
ncbi:phosphoprotein phosphatase [Tritrichomonas foetus]|uniref:Phosphoprotein phosphatase n=1 Tax=Tritrichomonas foetus TaxID=1144522 RepID=A0A1J4K549_9EUKA|nr:phosphoprotein phosphatase [Tritrichomonas foetus]|eukprot:OHT06106.1 phosphoprotein phosphatase [Tritrichomonas foetus]